MKEPNTPEEKRSTRARRGRAYIIKSEDPVDRPKGTQSSGKTRRQNADPVENLTTILSQKVVGQPAATKVIVPYIQMFQAGLAPEGRPVGIFLLLGPTGTGKTKTVEALAEILHGSEKNVLKVDCGEFQMEHEVAKLIGAPPGYLGHRETQPMLTQQKLNAVTTEKCDLSLVLLDEIEKAAPSMTRLLLGILDKAVLRLGDNTTVNFDKTLIFMTSNLAARNIKREIHPDFGFEALVPKEAVNRRRKLESVGLAAVKKKFTPEFVNRIDSVIMYQPLDAAALAAVLDHELVDLQAHLDRRLGPRTFRLEITLAARRLLLRLGTSDEYGARELKRTLHRQLMQPLASMLAAGQIHPGWCVRAEVNALRTSVVMHVVRRNGPMPLPVWSPL